MAKKVYNQLKFLNFVTMATTNVIKAILDAYKAGCNNAIGFWKII